MAPRPGVYVPAALVLAAWLIGTHLSGGYFSRDWYPAAIGFVLLLGVAIAAGGRVLPEPTVPRVGLALLAAFVAWSYLSMLWAASPASAWDASNELLLYLAAAWILALVPWTGRSAAIFVGAWSVGLALVCAITLVEASAAEHVGRFLYAFRFQSPIGYPNANAALGAMGFLAALSLSHLRQAPVVAQGVLLAAAAFLLEFSLLAQSRAAVAAVALALVFLVAVAAERWRLLLRVAVLGAALTASIGPVLDVYSTAKAGRPVGPAVDHAALWMGCTAVLAGIGGTVIPLLEGMIRLEPAGRLRARRAALAAVVVAAAGLAVLFGGRLVRATGDEVSAIASGKETSKTGGNRFAKTTLYERPDYWRVSLDMFSEHPVGGAGAGSFEGEYTVRRDEPKYSRYAHDVWLRALGEGGIVGAGLLVAFALLVLVFPLARLRDLDGWGRSVLSGSLALVLYFFLHASFDWLDEIPALTSPAIGLALIGLVLTSGARVPGRLRRGSGWAPVVLGTAALVALALVALVPPYLSHRYVEQALASWSRDPSGAYDDLDRAATLNPLSSLPRMTEGTIAVALDQPSRARRGFRRALAIEEVWYPHMELALLDAEQGRFRSARREIVEARRLSRKDPFIARAQRLVADHRRVDAGAFNRAMESEIRSSFTAQQK